MKTTHLYMSNFVTSEAPPGQSHSDWKVESFAVPNRVLSGGGKGGQEANLREQSLRSVTYADPLAGNEVSLVG